MIDCLVAALNKELELSATEIADTLWLALQIGELSRELRVEEVDLPQSSLKSREQEGVLPEREEETKPQLPQEPKAEVYPWNQRNNGFTGLSLRIPDAPALREPLTLARALKPLMRRIAAGTTLVLDEAATVERIAEEELWIPVLKPALEPWLDLELVVDQGISMQIWRQTIGELERLLKNYGIFRDVRVWSLIIDDRSPVQIRRGIGAATKDQPLRSPKELIDPTGRRLVLVVSDCVSSLWREGKVTPALDLWASHGAMAIVQMLPQWLWKRTALGRATEVRLQGLIPGEFNQNLSTQEVSLWDELDTDSGVKVPVFTLEADRMGSWANMLAGRGKGGTSGYVFKKEPFLRGARGDGSEDASVSLHPNYDRPENRVQAFRVTASPMARKLAGLLAAAPVISLPVVRLIQDTLLKESRQVHVAEVFLGGLLKPLGEIQEETDPNDVQYEFIDGVRDLLVESVPLGYVLNVVEAVSGYVAKKLGCSLDEFAGVLRNPQEITNGEITGNVGYFATITAQVLRNLGGEYARIAEELEEANRKVENVSTVQEIKQVEVDPTKENSIQALGGRYALLVGISNYTTGLAQLPSAVRDVDALRQVLVNPEIGGFAESDVEVLKDVDEKPMRTAIERLFANRSSDDLLLFYFSGHGITDHFNNFFLAGTHIKKDDIYSTAVPSTFLHGVMGQRGGSNRQVIILDCSHGGAFSRGINVKGAETVNRFPKLGGEGRAILTASGSMNYAFMQEGFELSLYTHFLVEGLKTGAADRDEDGYISVDELYEYVRDKISSVNDSATPEFYPVREGHRIIVAKAAHGDPKLKFRKEVERVFTRSNGKISTITKDSLALRWKNLGITPIDAEAIINEVLSPYQEYARRLENYEQALLEIIEEGLPFSAVRQAELQDYENHLGLREEDLIEITNQVIGNYKESSIEKNEQQEIKTSDSIASLEVGFNNPTLNDADINEETLRLYEDLNGSSDIESVEHISIDDEQEGNIKNLWWLYGLLRVSVSIANFKKVLSFLGDRLSNKTITLEVESNGRKVKITASNRKELEAAIEATKKFIDDVK